MHSRLHRINRSNRSASSKRLVTTTVVSFVYVNISERTEETNLLVLIRNNFFLFFLTIYACSTYSRYIASSIYVYRKCIKLR